MNLKLQVRITNQKQNRDELELAKEKSILCNVFFLSKGNFSNNYLMFVFCLYVSMYSVLNKFSEYIYIYISKTLLHTIFCVILKS